MQKRAQELSWQTKKKKLFFYCKESWEPGKTCGKRSQVQKMDAIVDEGAKDKVNKRPKCNQERNENVKDQQELDELQF